MDTAAEGGGRQGTDVGIQPLRLHPSGALGGPRHVIASCIVDTLHNQANTADSPLFVSEAALGFVVVAAGGVEIVRQEEGREEEGGEGGSGGGGGGGGALIHI